MSITWNDELDARLRAVWPDRNVTLDAMGAELGKSLSDVSRRAHKALTRFRSYSRKAASPCWAKISWMDWPVSFSISSSVMRALLY